MEDKALTYIRGLLNIKDDVIPKFDLSDMESPNYKDTIENINLILDENDPNAVKYLWNHIINPFDYKVDLDFTEDAKGFIESYLYKREEWLKNSSLYYHNDLSLNILRNINPPMEGENVILRVGTNLDEDLYYKHLIEDGDFLFYTMIPLESSNPKNVALNLYHPYSFIVENKKSKEALSLVALRPLRKDQNFQSPLEVAALSYYIYKEHRNKGYAKEAVALLMDAYFNERLVALTTKDYKYEMEANYNKAISISLDCSEENYASIALAKSLGFKEEAILHNTWYFGDEYSNGIFFFLDRDSYFKL
jgi:RimJ/RimL family protein N-acetyltransferase